MMDEQLQQFFDCYETYYPTVYKYSFYRMGGREADAKELVASIFRCALEHYPSFKNEYPVKAWLFRLTHQFFNTASRNQSSIKELSAGVTLDGKEIQLFQLTSAVQKLPQDLRAVIELRFYADCSPEDLATIFGISVNQVYVLVNRALASLKKLLP